MDFINLKTRISKGIGKYKYVCIVLLVGMVLMMIPEKNESITQTESEQAYNQKEENTTQEQLEEILCRIEGAGNVKVMLSIAQGERTVYQTDSTYTQNETNTDTKTQTILITDSGRNETGLIHQINPPVYQGAIVLAQGAEDPSVKLAIVNAVSNVTGLGADKISVLKMQ